MKNLLYLIAASACVFLASCSIDLERDRMITDSGGTAFPMQRSDSRKVVQTAINTELSEDYLIATWKNDLRVAAYSREHPSRDQLEVLIIAAEEGQTMGNEYSFRILNRGSLANNRAASRLSAAIRKEADRIVSLRSNTD